MKRKTTKEILVESFKEVAEKKHIDKITIRDITDNCGYSSATFYRQFTDKYDLIAWDYTRKLDEIMSGIGRDAASWRNALKEAAHYFHEQREYLRNLFVNTNGLDSFIAYMRDINFSRMEDVILKASKKESLNEPTEMMIRAYVLGNVQLTCEWILGRYDAGPDELADVYERTLPEGLRGYLSET